MRYEIAITRTDDAWELHVRRVADGLLICQALFKSRAAAQAALDLLWM